MPGDSPPNPETVFTMDPVAVLLHLARDLVNNQLSLANSARVLAAIPPEVIATAQGAGAVAKYRAVEYEWLHETLPSTIAALRLALEVYDTLGPGHHVIDDPVDAQLWNNKWFVWAQELAAPAVGGGS